MECTAARPLQPEDAGIAPDGGARRGAPREVGVGGHVTDEPLRAWNSQPRLELVGAREDAVALDEGDIHPVIAAAVVAEAAAEAVAKVAMAEDRRVHRAHDRRAIARGVGAREREVRQAA